MSDLYWLSDEQMARIGVYFPKSHGVPRVDDKKVLSGIIFVLKNGLRWRDAPREYDPPKTLYNRFIRWSKMGVFDRIFSALAEQSAPDEIMIDATHLKAHRTASNADSPVAKRNFGYKSYDSDAFRGELRKRKITPCIPRRHGQNHPQAIVKKHINAGTRLRICSQNSKTGDASQHATTDAPMHSYPQSKSHASESSGSINEY